MDLRCPVDYRQAVVCLAVSLACIGCSQAALLIHETDSGGVMTYLYKEDRGGPMGSPYRRAALKAMDKKCPFGYTVLKEGDVQGTGTMSGVEGREGDLTGRRWGLQFQCKGV
jgi:hypothetical protein